ncbi:MAG: HupE/UreJ family protein, partial [Vicinamibacterales bacterium]
QCARFVPRVRAAGGRLLAAVLTGIFVTTLSVTVAAHEIPSEVKIQVFFKPEGQRLRVLVRAPLEAMTDIDWPLLGVEGFLDISRADPYLKDASTLWLGDNLFVHENGTPLPYPTVAAVRASQPTDGAFESYDRALAQVLGPPLPPTPPLIRIQGMLDVLFEYPIASDRSQFTIYPRFVRLGVQTTTLIRFLPPDGPDRFFELHGDSGPVLLDPRWFEAAWRFTKSGFFHIVDGAEHVLFLIALVVPFRRMRALVPIVTSFTVAQTLTIIASVYDMAPSALWFPVLVETLTAASILYLAFENIAAPRLERRWIMTFAFGLVHGFAFAFELQQTLQFAGRHVLTSLVAFNIGIQAGLLLLLVLLVPSLTLFFRFVVPERLGTIVISTLVAHSAWHWTWERYGLLVRYQFMWPVIDAAFLALVLRWLMVLVVLVTAGYIIHGLVERVDAPGRRGEASGG